MGKKNDSKIIRWWHVIIVVLFICLFVLVLVFLMRGDSSIKNSDDFVEVTQSITCEKKGVKYSFLADAVGRGSIKINALFTDGKLDLISLVHRASYKNGMGSEQGETESRIAMNESLSKDSLNVEKLGVVFSPLDDVMQISLQVDANGIDGTTAKYFLLDGLNNTYSQNNVMKHYVDNGFSCRAEK